MTTTHRTKQDKMRSVKKVTLMLLFVFLIFGVFNVSSDNLGAEKALAAFGSGSGSGNDGGSGSDGGGGGSNDSGGSNFGSGTGSGNDNPSTGGNFGVGTGSGNDNPPTTTVDSGGSNLTHSEPLPLPTPTTPTPPTPPTCSLSVGTGSIVIGDSTSLSWTSTDATSGSIDNGIGTGLAPAGTTTITPSVSTTYTGTFTGSGGTVTCSVSVVVAPLPAPAPTCSLSVGSGSIIAGDSTSLSWTSTDATGGSIDNGVGTNVAPSGTTTIKPSNTTTYTGTFTGAGGSVTCSVTVTVVVAGGAGAYGGAGGLDSPSVSLNSLKGPGESPLAFITLSQIPYTGFDAGPIVTAFYWLVLVLWSGALAYAMLTYNLGGKTAMFFGGLLAPRALKKTPKPVRPVVEPVVTAELPKEAPTQTPGDELVLEVGENGHAPQIRLNRVVVEEVSEVEENKYKNNDGNASEAFEGTDEDMSYMPEDVHASVMLQTIARGDTEHALRTLQGYRTQQKNITSMLVALVCELDRLYSFRSGETAGGVDKVIEYSFKDWSTGDVLAVIHLLAEATDREHFTTHTGAKVAILRALEYAGKRQS